MDTAGALPMTNRQRKVAERLVAMASGGGIAYGIPAEPRVVKTLVHTWYEVQGWYTDDYKNLSAWTYWLRAEAGSYAGSW